MMELSNPLALPKVGHRGINPKPFIPALSSSPAHELSEMVAALLSSDLDVRLVKTHLSGNDRRIDDRVRRIGGL